MDRPNIFSATFEYDPADPEGYRSGVARVGRAAGAKENSVKLYEVAPGQALCPFHYEFVEEWLLVLEGGPIELRTPAGLEELKAGALVCFPTGPAGAHKLTNHGERPVRVLMFSSAREPAVAVYPDSDKMGIWPGHDADELMVRRSDGHLDYYDGET